MNYSNELRVSMIVYKNYTLKAGSMKEVFFDASVTVTGKLF